MLIKNITPKEMIMNKKYFTEEERKLAKKERDKFYRQKNKEKILSQHITYRETHKDEKKESNKLYYLKNKNKIDLQHKQYYQNNKEILSINHKNYDNDHKEERKDYHKQHYQNNKEKILTQQKNYTEVHKKERNQYNKNYNKNHRGKIREREFIRLKTDINYKLCKNLRGRFRLAIKNNQKAGSAVRDLGCSVEEAKLYWENLFYIKFNQPEMTWDNWGKVWQLHHIKPFESFNNLSDPNQVKEVCHYTNQKPLYNEDHIRRKELPHVS
jgi:hypothetical protein